MKTYDPYRSYSPTIHYRQPSRREIWAGIKEEDAFRTCCLCGEVIGKEDYHPGYPGGFVAHSACWQENARLGHSLSLMRSKLMVEAKYINDGTFYSHPAVGKKSYPLNGLGHEMQERQAKNQDLK